MCSDSCRREELLDKKYWLADMLILAMDYLNIDKRSLLEDYYPDETMLLLKRKGILDKRQDEKRKNNSGEPVEEVGWDSFWG